MRILSALMTGSLVAGALAIPLAIASPAAASKSQCKAGRACMWGSDKYKGCFSEYQKDRNSFNYWQHTCASHVHAGNGANSVRNEGQRCNVVFFDKRGRTGVGIRFENVKSGANYEDPHLKNGGGIGVGGNVAHQNWQNRISSLDFCR